MAELKMAFYGTNGHQPTGLALKMPRVSVVAAAGMPQAPGEATHYESLAALLADAGADLVSICSPRRDRQHEDIVAALEAGAHVFAEKPLATTMAGLDAIRAAAARTGGQVRSMTGMMYSPAFLEIKSLIDAGKLGHVVQVYAQKSYPYHDRRPQDPGVDGGLLEQTGVHAVSYIRHVTGMEFEEVFATDTRCGNPQEGELRIAGHIVARLTGGALCAILCNYANPKGIGFWGNDQLRVHGTGGMAEVMDAGGRSLVALNEQEPAPLADPTVTGGYEHLLPAYVDHLLDGSPMLLSQEDSFINTEVVIRAQESANSGQPLRVR